jgi:hypothetical protein
VAYYREDLARAHHLGFGFHADLCAPGVLRLLEPVLEKKGVVLELGCGSGLLTRYLVELPQRRRWFLQGRRDLAGKLNRIARPGRRRPW